MKTDPLSMIERRIREKAAFDHVTMVKTAIEDLTRGCYYGNNTVARLTLRTEVEQEDGTIKIVNRAPTIKEVGDLLARAISDFGRENVEARAVADAINKLQQQ